MRPNITLPNTQRINDDMVTKVNVMPNALFLSSSQNESSIGVVLKVEVDTYSRGDVVMVVITVVALRSIEQLLGRTLSYIGPKMPIPTADPAHFELREKATAILNVSPLNHDAAYMLHNIDKVSPPTPKTSLPKYTTILLSINTPSVAIAFPK